MSFISQTDPELNHVLDVEKKRQDNYSIHQGLPNQSVYVPVKTPYRLENHGTEPLCLIEVQSGGLPRGR